MQEVYKNIYLKELTLPNNPLRSLNFYIVKGEDRSMIIDTGFNLEETKQEILDVFRELDLKPENTILFLTHLHSDHTGLAAYFQDMGLEIYMSEKDGTLMNNSVAQDNPRWEHIVEFGRLQGLHVDQLEIGDHPGFKFARPHHSVYECRAGNSSPSAIQLRNCRSEGPHAGHRRPVRARPQNPVLRRPYFREDYAEHHVLGI